MIKEAEKYIKPDPWLKRVRKSMPAFMAHYWLNTKWLIGFSVAALISFVYFLHIDRDPVAFWWSLGGLLFINAIRFFGLLIKWRV